MNPTHAARVLQHQEQAARGLEQRKENVMPDLPPEYADMIMEARKARGASKQMVHTIVHGGAALRFLILQGQLMITYEDALETIELPPVALNQMQARGLAGLFADHAASFVA